MSIDYGARDSTNQALATKFGFESNESLSYFYAHCVGGIGVRSMPCDCTSFTLDADSLVKSIETLTKTFNFLLALMSVNGRTNCFFTLAFTKYTPISSEKFIEFTKQYPVVGLNQYPSVRNDAFVTMVSGVLKCPNPQMRGYDRVEYDPNHDYLSNPIYNVIGE